MHAGVRLGEAQNPGQPSTKEISHKRNPPRVEHALTRRETQCQEITTPSREEFRMHSLETSRQRSLISHEAQSSQTHQQRPRHKRAFLRCAQCGVKNRFWPHDAHGSKCSSTVTAGPGSLRNLRHHPIAARKLLQSLQSGNSGQDLWVIRMLRPACTTATDPPPPRNQCHKETRWMTVHVHTTQFETSL